MEHTSAYINCQEPDCAYYAAWLLTCKETMVESNGIYGNAHLLCESTHFGGIVCQDRFYQRICTVIISAFVPDV